LFIPTGPAHDAAVSLKKRIVVLVSGAGSNLSALLRADLGIGQVVLVASDRDSAGGLERAQQAGIPTRVVSPADFPDRAAWDTGLAEALAPAEPDLLVLAGFQRLLGPELPKRYPTLNVHPSLLPAFPGQRAVEQALAWGVRVTGCTVHFVDEGVDTGPVIAQEAVAVEPDDTPQSLHARIQAVEHRLLPACVALACADRLVVEGRRVTVRS